MYKYGRGISKDWTVAAEWYRKSAEQGYAPAKSNLTLMMFDGFILEGNRKSGGESM